MGPQSCHTSGAFSFGCNREARTMPKSKSDCDKLTGISSALPMAGQINGIRSSYIGTDLESLQKQCELLTGCAGWDI